MKANSTKEKIIVLTGTSSGLGKYIYSRHPEGYVIKTESSERDIQNIQDHKIDVLIHCAFDASIFVSNYEKYLQTNVLYTSKLIDQLQPKKVIYISSVNVYLENDTNYKLSKLLSENIIKDKVDNHLILRCSAITGPTMREESVGSIVPIFKDKNPNVRLSNKSLFNYILQEDICDFIDMSVIEKITGTFNFVSSTCIELEEICRRYDKKATFGEFVYTTPIVDNKKIKKIFPQADRTSEEVLDINYMRINNVIEVQKPGREKVILY